MLCATATFPNGRLEQQPIAQAILHGILVLCIIFSNTGVIAYVMSLRAIFNCHAKMHQFTTRLLHTCFVSSISIALQQVSSRPSFLLSNEFCLLTVFCGFVDSCASLYSLIRGVCIVQTPSGMEHTTCCSLPDCVQFLTVLFQIVSSVQ